MANATEFIRISKETKNTLDKLGNKNDTYNDIIERLLKKRK
jgi:predicted CopG family antitoxin